MPGSARSVALALAAMLMPVPTPCLAAEAESPPAGRPKACWIWNAGDDPAPKNRFTWFRKVVELKELPADGRLRIAADSNAAVWINGHSVLRKVPRYHEQHITAVEVNAGPYLRIGGNVVLVRHHNWGDIITFQRTGNKHAGLYIDSDWVVTDSSWRCVRAGEFAAHEKQIVGTIGDRRIRYPQIVDGSRLLPGGAFDDPNLPEADWGPVTVVTDGPWPVAPETAESPPQREYALCPQRVLAAGRVQGRGAPGDDPMSMAAGIHAAKCEPSEAAARAAGELLGKGTFAIEGRAGEWHYVTFDFGMPVHGYPFVSLESPKGVTLDFGYCELTRSLYDGAMHVRPDGWINPEGVVGAGYADRYITRKGPQHIEMPDERTARWFALHVYFPADGKVVFKQAGFTRSQHPVDLKGSFSCGDERIAQIVKLCLIHAEVSMSDTYVDTPGREDGQWIEDDRPRAILASRWFGDSKLRELMIRTLAQSQGPDGHLHPFAPSNYPAYPAPYDWDVQWVAMLWDHYMWTGDTAIIRRYLPNLELYWRNALSRLGEDGIWRTKAVLADIRVGLHPENDRQSSGIVTPWIVERLRWSAQMAEAIGERKLAAGWQATADKMAEAFRKHHIVPADGQVPAHVGDRLDTAKPDLKRGYSQAGQTIAVTTGLLTRDEARADLDYAFPAPDGSPPKGVTRWNNPTYSYRSLRALSECGMTQRAVAHLIERYAPYLPGNPRNTVPPVLQGPYGGPLPEYWLSREDLGLKAGEKNSAQPSDETGSHGWGSVPLIWLHDSLLGVTITEPGGAVIRIAPDAGGLPFVAGHTATPKGLVWVHWDTQQWRLDIEIPPGVVADVVVPAACAGKRTQAVQSAGKVEPTGENRFRVREAGRYVFEVRG